MTEAFEEPISAPAGQYWDIDLIAAELREAREDWRILRAASAVLGTALPYDTIDALRARMESVAPALGKIGYLPRFGCADAAGPAGDPDAVADSPIGAAFAEYHRTDAISRASPTMAACVAALSAPSAPPALAAE